MLVTSEREQLLAAAPVTEKAFDEFHLYTLPRPVTLRDRETNPVRKRIFSILSLGWRNSEPEWRHFARMYLFLAAFSTPRKEQAMHSLEDIERRLRLPAPDEPEDFGIANAIRRVAQTLR